MRVSLFLTAILATATPAAADGWRPTLVYETGPAAVLQNDGEYGATGTRYGADDVGQTDNLVRVSRLSGDLGIGRHTLILLYAPFELRTQVRLGNNLQFRDEQFEAGTVVDHRYLFEGYRASYLYRVLDGSPLSLEISLYAASQMVAAGRRAPRRGGRAPSRSRRARSRARPARTPSPDR